MLTAFLSSLVRFYRKRISPLKAPCCRFYPTCSQYALDALSEWGPLAGTGMAVWRILRCNPFGKGGIEPVPENPKRHRAPTEGRRKVQSLRKESIPHD